MYPIFVVLMFFTFWVKEFFFTHIDVGVVTMNERNCLNFNKIHDHSRRCQSKYCAIKMMKKIKEKIDSAESTIDIAMYNFTNQILVQCIQRACKRGVAVRLIIDKSMLASRVDDGRTIEVGRDSAIKLQEAGKFW